jgi:TusA-related sulfurtransferase
MGSRGVKRNGKTGDRSELSVEHLLDVSGMIVPLTLLKIMQAFRKIGAGEIMDVVGTDPDTRRDCLKVLGTFPCEVICVRDERDRYLIRIRKGRGGEVQGRW